MSIVLEPPRMAVWTEALLQALPGDGFRYEVVNDKLLMSPKNNLQHEQICQRLNFALESFNQRHRLGAVFGSSLGFWLRSRNCRAPDISFVPKSRLVQLGLRPDAKSFFPGAPDLAIEVLSAGNTRSEIGERPADYFESGTQLAWIIDPAVKTVEVFHSTDRHRMINAGGWLDGEQILPGFRYSTADLFKAADW